MRAFVFNEHDKVYVAAVNSVLKLNLSVKFLATGVSLRQASRIYHALKEELGLVVLGCISDVDVANQRRIVCAINLQYLKEMLSNVWAVSIAIDAGNSAGNLQALLWILWSEFPKLLLKENRRTKQVIHFLQCFPLLYAQWTQGCSQLRWSSSDLDSKNVIVMKISNELTTSSIG